MKITYLELSEAENLFQAYNEQIAGVPHCYPVSPEEFEQGFPYKEFADEPDYFEEIHSEIIIAADEGGKIVAFADVAVADIEEYGHQMQKGFIRFMTYQPGHRPSGQAVLEAAERYLFGPDIGEIRAFRLNYRNDHCGYRFYHIGYSAVSDRMAHVCALFQINGYRISGGEIFSSQPKYDVQEPILPDDGLEIVLRGRPSEQAALPGLYVIAFRDGREIGSCNSISVGEFCRADEAQGWLFISGLDVVEEEQGRGLGHYLLQRNLWEMQKSGYKNTVISNDLRNYRAHLFYTNYGYELADTCYEFVKGS